uniref:DNA topoisomerase I n=1 Tax=Daucus carota TaxID=4039 RepID=Q9XGL1_DAUCA|nr:DNA topoisomerase I [Daucus carota]
MEHGSDSEDDKPLIFKRSNTSVKQNQAKPRCQKIISAEAVWQVGRLISDVRSTNGHDSNVQKGKTVPSTKGSPVVSPLASPKASVSSSKASQVKPPVASTKASTSGADQSRQNSQQNRTAIVKAERPSGIPKEEPDSGSEDSDDDKPLNSRLPVGGSKGSISEVNRRPSSSGPAAFEKDLGIKEEDSEDDIPLSHKFKQKSNAGESSNAYDSDEGKPFASKPRQNGTNVKDNVKNPSTAINKRPSAEVKCSGQSPVKKATVQLHLHQVRKLTVKAEPKKEADDSDDDNATISQRVKKPATPISKASDKKKSAVSVSSSLNKVNKNSKKITKSTQFSKSLKVPPGSGEGQKWTTLVHNGVIFPPPYKPHGVKMLYKESPVDLTLNQEEVHMIAVMQILTEYLTKPVFRENVMNDWKIILGRNHIIKNLDDCDFTPIYEWFRLKKEKKKQMSAEEKKAVKEEKLKQEEKYMWAVVDGVKENVGNFRVEPPGLFRGRESIPKMGKLKKRISPSDITINIGKDAPIPECPIPGESWKEVRHDNTVTWLAYWNDPINGKEFKYVFLAASSSLKGQSDKEKYEKARKLKGYIEGIRTAYTKDFSSKDVTKRQIAVATYLIDKLALRAGNAVATYLIDKLALRAGNEKDDDEADTVGCCTLKVENVEPRNNPLLKLDFLPKDSIRYQKRVEVEIPVFKAIQQFRSGKKGSDNLFDKLDTCKLNAHLKELMPGLSAKVFRTYNASITLDEMLNKETKGGDVSQKVAVYQHANKEVAIICNHQRSVSKSHSTQMMRLDEKINKLKNFIEELKTDLSRAKKGKPPLKGSDGKTKRNMNPEAIEKKIAQTNVKIEKMERDKETKEDLKTVALGTSKINYLDPRITVAWCKRYEVPIEKMFNKSLLAKFAWAMDVEPSFRF